MIMTKLNQINSLRYMVWGCKEVYYCIEKEVCCHNASFPLRSRSTFYAQRTQNYLFVYINNQLLNCPDTATQCKQGAIPYLYQIKTISCSY